MAALDIFCDICKEPIGYGESIRANNQTLHPDCFVCHQCFQPFPDDQCFPYDGRVYCEHDFKMLFGPSCAGCGQFIMGRCITALDRKWHPEHLNCFTCKISLASGNFVGRNGMPYCKPCNKVFKETLIPSVLCARCHKPIEGDDFIIINGEKMHLSHFTCALCNCTLTKGSREYEGKAYCVADYDKVRVAICAGCLKPILGRVISALGKQWHPEHFVCSKCERPFSGDLFFEHAGHALCSQHYKELFADQCFLCTKMISGDTISTMNKQWCNDHFACHSCDTVLNRKNVKFVEWDLKPTCKFCYDKLPTELRRKLKRLEETEKKKAKAIAKNS